MPRTARQTYGEDLVRAITHPLRSRIRRGVLQPSLSELRCSPFQQLTDRSPGRQHVRPPRLTSRHALLAIILSGIGVSIGGTLTPSTTPTSIQTSQVSDADCRKTLRCWAEKHTADAAVRCREPVERLAKNNFEWTDGMFEPKSSHYRWRNEGTGEVTYIGDKIKYQNCFGAWTFYTYECRSVRTVLTQP